MTPEEITSMFKTTFGTRAGKKCLAHLKRVFYDRKDMTGDGSMLEIGKRIGQRELVMQIMNEVEKK